MAEMKTKVNAKSVDKFLKTIKPEERREDCLALVRMMKEATKTEPRMWGPGIVGFGSYHYKYASGREGDWFLVGFAPRKQDLTLYIMPGFARYKPLMAKLGKHKTGISCLYLKRLAEVDTAILREMVADSVAHMGAKVAARNPKL